MKRTFIFLTFSLLLSYGGFATQHVITNSGNSFSPDEILVNIGDTVVFNLSTSHDAVEVSEATWNANGTTSNGGFSLPLGGGMVVMQSAGMHYFVCTVHASMGMKGKIEVSDLSVAKIEYAPEQIRIFPNPVEDKLSIRGMKDIDIIEIYDVTGSTIYRSVAQNGLGEAEISVAELVPGLYFLVLRGEDLAYSFRLLKQ